MATRVGGQLGSRPGGAWQRGIGAARAALVRAATVLAAVALIIVAVALVAALIDYSPRDPSFGTATGRLATNVAGPIGAYTADLLLQVVGLLGYAAAPVLVVAALRLLQGRAFAVRRASLGTLAGMVLGAAAFGATWPPRGDLPAGHGGIVGLLADRGAALVAGLPALAGVPVAAIVAILLGPLALGLLVWGSGLGGADLTGLARLWPSRREELPGNTATLRAPAREVPEVRRLPRPAAVDAFAESAPAAPRSVVVSPPAAPAPGKRIARERQPALDLGDGTVLPSLSLLKPPPAAPAHRVDPAALEQNARLLESVLDDFGVKGRIGDVRPGPVVTMYELEPAPGIKASRVIGLADDIARSMSALSARVAVVPGRNVIGIELPNLRREMVSLSELLGSSAFEDKAAALPLILGKDIAGDPVIADLSPMPHLLIAGTTGSGKSVGLNAMILSLLYRLTPRQCQLIMIDPKMLELSVYDRIPHLLAPVVTEPAKAIRALKWTVEEMDDRYRKMTTIGVRNVAGFNAKIAEFKASGKPFVRRIHTGYDDNGDPVIEEQTLDFEPLPLIVVIVDELADLMMTAGKEVEFLIQRLAQKARAAGIHLIMATQRPSVDVITGVIKANLPTRISFQVTSKIDSRTILGEQGAEQLLGKGDMLYMTGGKQLTRVHGPFVSDEEVEAVADHWRTQGRPQYVEAVTEEPPDIDGQFGFDTGDGGMPRGGPGGAGGGGGEEAEIYARAIQIVAASQKASTSYLQRQLRVGYNNAARLIERMEGEGLVGKPDHVGRREVLIDENGDPR